MAKEILNMEPKRLYMTTQEVAELLEVSESTIRDLAQSGIIPATKMGERKWQFLRSKMVKFAEGKANLPLERYHRQNTVAIFVYLKKDVPPGLVDGLREDIGNILDEPKYEVFVDDHDIFPPISTPKQSSRARNDSPTPPRDPE